MSDVAVYLGDARVGEVFRTRHRGRERISFRYAETWPLANRRGPPRCLDEGAGSDVERLSGETVSEPTPRPLEGTR